MKYTYLKVTKKLLLVVNEVTVDVRLTTKQDKTVNSVSTMSGLQMTQLCRALSP